MPSAYHMVHYRRFESAVAGQSLEALCRQALGTATGGETLWERIEDRVMDWGPSGEQQVVLNRVVDLTSAVFGEACLTDRRGVQALLETRASMVKLSEVTTAEVFSLGERQAPQGTQFVRGMAYWLAIGDHYFFVKTQSMTPELLRSYIEWLLTARTQVLGTDFRVSLQAEFDRAQVGGDIGEVRSLRLSGKSVPQIAVYPVDSPEREKTMKTQRRIAERFAVFEEAKQLADVVLGKGRADSLVESLGPEEYLSADTQIKVQGRRTVRSRDKMKEIANELANTTDAEVRVEGKDGRLSNEDAILRTRMPFELESEESNLLVFDNVADQLQIVYRRFVEDRKIAA